MKLNWNARMGLILGCPLMDGPVRRALVAFTKRWYTATLRFFIASRAYHHSPKQLPKVLTWCVSIVEHFCSLTRSTLPVFVLIIHKYTCNVTSWVEIQVLIQLVLSTWQNYHSRRFRHQSCHSFLLRLGVTHIIIKWNFISSHRHTRALQNRHAPYLCLHSCYTLDLKHI